MTYAYNYLCIIFGATLFQIFFQYCEVRYIKIAYALIMFSIQPIKLLLVLRKNRDYDLPDWYCLVLYLGIQFTINAAIDYLPMGVIFSKIIPKDIEATCFALYVSLRNLSQIIQATIGTLINDAFLHVDKHDSKYYWV